MCVVLVVSEFVEIFFVYECVCLRLCLVHRYHRYVCGCLRVMCLSIMIISPGVWLIGFFRDLLF